MHEPGRVVGWDGFFWKHPTRQLVTRAMIIVDEGSRHFVPIALETKATHRDLSNDKWEECFEAYSVHWAMHYGRPDVVRVDPAGAYRQLNLRARLESYGILVDEIPGEAHWKMGITERMVQFCKTLATKLAYSAPELSPQAVFSFAAQAHGDWYNVKGFSPPAVAHRAHTAAAAGRPAHGPPGRCRRLQHGPGRLAPAAPHRPAARP